MNTEYHEYNEYRGQQAVISPNGKASFSDMPVPEPPNRRMHSRAQIFLDIARRDNLTIRQLYLSVAGGNGQSLQ